MLEEVTMVLRKSLLGLGCVLLLAQACVSDWDEKTDEQEDPAGEGDAGMPGDGDQAGDGDQGTGDGDGDGDGVTAGDGDKGDASTGDGDLGDGDVPGDGDAPGDGDVGDGDGQADGGPGDGDTGDGDSQADAGPGDGDTGDGDTGDGDTGDGDGQDGGVIDPPPVCPANTCCVDGKKYLAGQESPSNVCAACDPSESTDDFSPTTGNDCGAGCRCDAGERTETVCNDGADNDGDSALNCADNDCHAQVCKVETDRVLLPSEDTNLMTYNFNGNQVTENKDVLSLASTMSVFSFATMKFAGLPNNQVDLDVEEAYLIFYEEVGTASVAAKSPSGAIVDTTVPDTSAGFRRLNITSLVQDWADGKAERSVLLYYNNSGMGSARIRSSEHADEGSRPYLEITYKARCFAAKCASF